MGSETQSLAPSMKDRLFNVVRHFAKGRPPVGQTPADVVHRENKWSLLHYRPMEGAEVPRGCESPILLVPSLINRHYVLDLMPGKSFAEYLVAQGHEVYIIDWGTPGPEDRFLTFEDICEGYLGRAVRHVARQSPTHKAHLLGYCLGGTLTTVYAAAHPEHVASMAVLAAPVDFSDEGMLSIWSRGDFVNLEELLEATGNMPSRLMQLGFHLLRPTLNLSKAVHMWDKAWDDEFMDGFLALETWGSDNVDFPGACFLRYIREFYQRNALIRGEFALAGHTVHLRNLVAPVLAVTFEHDNIVPVCSAAPLVENVGACVAERLHLSGGHVGAVVSRKASQSLWPKISQWFLKQDALGAPGWKQVG